MGFFETAEITNHFDDLILKRLEPFGINRQNIHEQEHRIMVAMCNDCGLEWKYVYVDEKLAFTIIERVSEQAINIYIKDPKENNK